ncbi:MAG TPA: hypothetical protein DCQ04_00625 [Actinobacteria bacterium]|jgi:hypothetical protein|nr:hypothetical protein [Actinomycetota bacterium]
MDNAGATPKLDSSRTVEEVAFRELRFPAAQEFQAWRWTGVDTFECNWHKLATGCPTPGCDCGGHFGIPCNLNHFLDIVESCLEDDRHDDRPLIVDDASRWLADPSVTCGLAIIPEEPFPAQQRRCLTTWFAPLLWAVAATLDDLVHVYSKLTLATGKAARKDVSNSAGYSVDQLQAFINSTIKHAAQRLTGPGDLSGSRYCWDNHATLFFATASGGEQHLPLSPTGWTKARRGTAIVYPSISKTCETLTGALQGLDVAIRAIPERVLDEMVVCWGTV